MAGADAEALLTAAAAGLERLKHQYERFWQGLERPEPERERDALRSAFRSLLTDAEGIRNTALVFRIRSAQASFRAFDALCERRNREPGVGRARNLRRADADAPEVAKAGPTPVPATPADPLYQRLVASLAACGRVAPPADKFAQQVAAAMQEARRAAPNASLRPELQVGADGRVRLLVVEAGDP